MTSSEKLTRDYINTKPGPATENDLGLVMAEYKYYPNYQLQRMRDEYKYSKPWEEHKRTKFDKIKFEACKRLLRSR